VFLGKRGVESLLRENMDSQDIKKSHFDEALKKVKPSVTKNTIANYKKIEDSFLQSAKAAIPAAEGYLG